VLPMLLLGLVAFVLYRHIMTPLRKLEQATRSFALGRFDTRVRQSLGKRSDELSELADTFDRMAERIGALVVSQRQLIADVSHELRTPLTRLDIAVQNLGQGREAEENLKRIVRESANMRGLVDDSLTLAWLENERPDLQQESFDLTDLIDVLAEDARFEYPDRNLALELPDSAQLSNSNHRSLGQALENILRNALRFTPEKLSVSVSVKDRDDHYRIRIEDEGGGVPEQDLERIFQPFFRTETSRPDRSGFGLGLALAKRQIAAVGGVLRAANISGKGLAMIIDLPKSRTLPA
jgi:two-component system, OmpR family, sensor histidine kinase PfeS